MHLHTLSCKKIEKFILSLVYAEKSPATIEKYRRDLLAFYRYLPDGKQLSKEQVVAYKSHLCGLYAPASVNSMLAAINSFFQFMEWGELKVKSIKIQKNTFCRPEQELTRKEYYRLLAAAKARKNKRLYLILETICSCGLRISELQYITIGAVRKGRAEVNCKGKRRAVLLPAKLCSALINYAKHEKITEGMIFVTRSGNPVDRSNIWSDMKKLCAAAHVDNAKVFPHNLRHLFARTYYSAEKDLFRLADILGHSDVNTTRIYTLESGKTHARQVAALGLVQ